MEPRAHKEQGGFLDRNSIRPINLTGVSTLRAVAAALVMGITGFPGTVGFSGDAEPTVCQPCFPGSSPLPFCSCLPYLTQLHDLPDL